MTSHLTTALCSSTGHQRSVTTTTSMANSVNSLSKLSICFVIISFIIISNSYCEAKTSDLASTNQFVRFGKAGDQFVRFGKDKEPSHQFVRFGRDSPSQELDNLQWPPFLRPSMIPATSLSMVHPGDGDGQQDLLSDPQPESLMAIDPSGHQDGEGGERWTRSGAEESILDTKNKKLYYFLKSFFPMNPKRHTYRGNAEYAAFAHPGGNGSPAGVPLDGAEMQKIASFIRFG